MRSGTERAAAGAALLVALVVVVLCAPAVAGRTLAGEAVAALKISLRPVAGQCLAPLNTPDQLNTVVDVVPLVPCTQPHSAEILTVRTLDPADWPKRPDVSDARFTSGELSQTCNQLAAQYLGWGTPNAQHRLRVSFFTRLTVAGELDWSLGHRWYACELMPPLLDYPISWIGTARNASNATPPSPFAKCADEPTAPPVSCDLPHHAEQLTQSYGGPLLSASDCSDMVARVIGTPDPTFGGQLAVVARSSTGGTACWVTPTSARALTGTLINHGTAPLPPG